MTPTVEPDVFLVWRDDWDYRAVESAYDSLVAAQAALLDLAWPEAGPRGGRRPPRPAVEWMHDASGSVETWTPIVHGSSSWRWRGDDYNIERRPVHSAIPRPGGDSDGTTQPYDP